MKRRLLQFVHIRGPCDHCRRHPTQKTQRLLKLESKDRGRATMGGTATCIDIILAIILPPLGVFLKYGCKIEFWICLLLTILGYIPGIIYAVWIITKN